MIRLRGVGARLSLALLLVVAGALAIVYAVLVPILERSLVDAKIAQLVSSGESLSRPRAERRHPVADLRGEQRPERERPRADRGRPRPPAAARAAAGRLAVDASPRRSPTRLRARVRDATTQSGRLEQGEEPFAEAAVPVAPQATVLVLRAPLEDTLANVALVRRRLLLARRARADRSRWRSATAPPGCSRAGCGSWSARPSGSRAGASTSRSRTRGTTRSASSPRRSTGCGCASRASSTPAASSSRTPRTSCRTPIFSLGGFLELLDDEDLDEETRREFLTTAREQVGRLTKLATDLLDLSRLDAGRVQLERAAARPRGRRPLDLRGVRSGRARQPA